MGMIDTWLEKHRPIYTAATRHPFILAIRDGSVDLTSFKTWLGQDYLFVRQFVPFVGNVLIRAGKESGEGSDMEVVLGGLSALNDEIEWFKSEGSKWSVDFSNVVPQKTNQDYCSLMGEEVKYPVIITAFWAIEAVYQESFAHCLEDGNKTPPELTGACTRWGNDGFRQYCSSVKTIADRCLEKASGEVLAEAEAVLLSQHRQSFSGFALGQLCRGTVLAAAVNIPVTSAGGGECDGELGLFVGIKHAEMLLKLGTLLVLVERREQVRLQSPGSLGGSSVFPHARGQVRVVGACVVVSGAETAFRGPTALGDHHGDRAAP